MSDTLEGKLSYSAPRARPWHTVVVDLPEFKGVETYVYRKKARAHLIKVVAQFGIPKSQVRVRGGGIFKRHDRAYINVICKPDALTKQERKYIKDVALAVSIEMPKVKLSEIEQRQCDAENAKLPPLGHNYWSTHAFI